MKQHQPNSFISRAAAMLLTVIMAFAGAQTAGAQEEPKPCKITFDISGEGTVEFRGETVTNGQTIDFHIPFDDVLTITPKTGYYVSSVTYDATAGLHIRLNQDDDFQWNLNIDQYGGPKTPTITVHIVFDKGLADGADEASAVVLTADNDLSHLAGGWYKVESDLTIGHTVNLLGDTHITIASGKTLTVNTSDKYGIYGSVLTDENGISGYALTVSGEGTLSVSANLSAIYVDNYTQTGCAVTLSGYTHGLNAENNVSISGGSLTTSGAYYGIDTNVGSITISGGTVSSSGELCGLYATQAMNITGGTVNASSNSYGIRGYSVSITGGQVTASSGGIWSYGDITLGLTSATDYITASGFTMEEGKHVKIADGQTLYGGGFPSASYTGTIGDPSALNGLMLRPTAAVTKSGTNEYTIWNAAGWDAFCDALQDNDTYNRFSGKTVKLGADITVSRMAGGDSHDFTGTFDGGGNTLTFNHGTSDSYASDEIAAPFYYVSTVTVNDVETPAAICNLHVSGDIYTTAKYAAGIVGRLWGTVTIENCAVSTVIHSSVGGDGTHGGIVALNSGTLSINGCVFDGKLLSTGTNATTNCGGFVGYGNGTITNSLYAPADLGTGETEVQTGDVNNHPSATFARDNATVTNSYYTRTLGTAQGKQLRTIAAGEGVTLGHDGVATEYSVSGITAYKASGASGDSDPFTEGILYDEVLYAGSGDEVSLTLTNSSGEAPLGYYYPYSVSAGTLSGSTLTMPDEDVTVTVNAALRSTGVAVPVSYVDAGGNTQTAQAIALDGTETDLDRSGEETWYFVGLPTVAFGRLVIQYDINLILADGCTMNVTSATTSSCITVKNNLHIYGQAEGTGILNAQNQVNIFSSDVIFIQDGTLRIHGGNVITTYNGTNKDAKAIYFSRQYTAGDVLVIDGGTLTANGNDGYGIFINGGDARINGGQVTATGGNSGIASSSVNFDFIITQQIPGTLTLSGGTLTASSIETFSGKDKGTIAVAPGYTYTDGSNIYDSATASADLAALTKVTLWPYLALADAADNTAAITDHAGKTLAVALSGRTLYKDGSWNTLVLPFSVGDEEAKSGHELDGTPLEGATLMTLGNSPACNTGFDAQTGTLNLDFLPAKTVEPGVAYIVKWPIPDGMTPEAFAAAYAANPDDYDLKNPVFTGVTVTNDAPAECATTSDDTYVTFVGTYGPAAIYADPATALYLGAANKLYWPTATDFELKPFRAYFQLNNGLTCGDPTNPNAARAITINFGDSSESTGIVEITDPTPGPSPAWEGSAAGWYSMDGRKLQAQPTKAGLYIHGGRKVAIK